MSRSGRAIAGVVLIGVGVAVGTGWWWPSTAEATAEVREPVRAVEVDADSGDVTVRAEDVDTTTVRQRFDYTWNTPDDAFEVDDGTLTLSDCGWNCTVAYEVVVPLGTTVHGEVDSANLTLHGVSDVDVRADSGDIILRDIDGTVRAEADSGDVHGEGLRGEVEASADSGNVQLQLDVPADVTAEADSGDIELTVPAADYRVDGETDSGSRDIDVRQDPDAPYTLRLDSDSGDVVARMQ